MAITKVLSSSALVIEVENGTDKNGAPAYRKKSFSGVKENLSQEEASTLMDAIIAKNIFITKNGTLASKYSAQLVQRQVTEFKVA